MFPLPLITPSVYLVCVSVHSFSGHLLFHSVIVIVFTVFQFHSCSLPVLSLVVVFCFSPYRSCCLYSSLINLAFVLQTSSISCSVCSCVRLKYVGAPRHDTPSTVWFVLVWFLVWSSVLFLIFCILCYKLIIHHSQFLKYQEHAITLKDVSCSHTKPERMRHFGVKRIRVKLKLGETFAQ